MRKRFLTLPIAAAAATPLAAAHCPLCTLGAAAAAGGATMLGMNVAAVGVFIGAFGAATGWWVAKLLKQRFVPFQEALLVLASFLLTIIPISALFPAAVPLYVPWLGAYGLTLAVPLFVTGSVVGGALVALAPALSRWVTRLRGAALPYQGVSITFALLLIASAAFQVVLP